MVKKGWMAEGEATEAEERQAKEQRPEATDYDETEEGAVINVYL